MEGTVARKPAVAGQFYPGDADRLREMVRRFIADSSVRPAPEETVAIVSPHAGYVYSGATAGYAYARVKGKRPKRVLLLGSSHRYHIATAAVFPRGAFETPTGVFPIDEALAGRIASELGFEAVEPHLYEHSLEVQLPFLAEAIGPTPIVPVLFGAPAGEAHARAGEQLANIADASDLVVVSTDLSHYLSQGEATERDRVTLETILTRDWRRFVAGVAGENCMLCGSAAVTAGMAYALARGASEWTVLDYRTSAAASGESARVVGYAAVSMERPR